MPETEETTEEPGQQEEPQSEDSNNWILMKGEGQNAPLLSFFIIIMLN
jgi:hypothetical protein